MINNPAAPRCRQENPPNRIGRFVGAYCHTALFILLAVSIVIPATILAATAPAPTKAAPQTSANFEQEWSKLIAAAQQEGTRVDRLRRRAVAPVSSGGRCLQQEIQHQSRSLHRQRHRHGQSRAGRAQSRQVHHRRGADQLARESAALGAVGLAGAAHAAADSSRRHRHVEMVQRAPYVRRQVRQVHADLSRRLGGPIREPGTTPTKSKKPRSPRSPNKPMCSIPSGRARSPAKAWAIPRVSGK